MTKLYIRDEYTNMAEWWDNFIQEYHRPTQYIDVKNAMATYGATYFPDVGNGPSYIEFAVDADVVGFLLKYS